MLPRSLRASRSLRTARTSRDGDTPAGGPVAVPDEVLATGIDEVPFPVAEKVAPTDGGMTALPAGGLPDLTTSLPLIDPTTVTFVTDEAHDEAGGFAAIEAVIDAAPAAADGGAPVGAGGSAEPDLLRDALLIEGPATALVIRRAQHHRRRRFSASGQPRIGIAAVTLSAATVAVLAAGTVQGLRADDQRALLGRSSLMGRGGVTTALPDSGGDEEAISARRSTAVVAQETEQRLQAEAAAQAAAERAAQLQAAARAAAERSAAEQRAAAAASARQQAAQQAAQQASRSASRTAPVSGGSPQATAQALLAQRGWSGQWTCLNQLWMRESGWNYLARNPSSGAYGIPQALPGRKMASAGADWGPTRRPRSAGG